MTFRLKVFLLGGTGQIGSCLRAQLSSQVDLIAPDRATLDCERHHDVFGAIVQSRPHCVVNAAAYTGVDAAENDRERAELLNATLPRAIAEACERIGAGLLHFSTDYVFDGMSTRPYTEGDRTAPLNWYGLTKLAGERGALDTCPGAIVLRTSWIYGQRGTNFFLTMRRLARERDELRIVADQRGAPTAAPAVAAGAASLLRALGQDRAAWHANHGIFHLTAGGETTWFDFASELLRIDPRRAEHKTTRLVPVPTSEYPTPARRPAYSVLNCGLIDERFGIRLRPWRDELEIISAS